METLLKASEADWALAKRRERVLSKLAASKECSRAMIHKACVKLQLSRAMVFRLLARYREDRRLSALLLHPRGRKRGSGGLREEQEQIITGQIRKFYLTREKRPVAALHREIATDCGRKNFPVPSYGTVLRRLRAYDSHTLVANAREISAPGNGFALFALRRLYPGPWNWFKLITPWSMSSSWMSWPENRSGVPG